VAQELHESQARILRELLFNNGSNFAALNSEGLSNDHFTFHIKKLVKEGWVEKTGKKYYLTQKGKVLAGTLDIDSLKIEKWGKASVAVAAVKNVKGKAYYLVQQRLKEPFFGRYGFINGKIRYGETSEATAIRELREETGLTGKPIILCVYHKLRGPSKFEISLDNFFFLYLVKNPTGKLIDTVEGKNSWKTAEEIRKLQTFPAFDVALDIAVGGKYRPYFEMYIKLDQI